MGAPAQYAPDASGGQADPSVRALRRPRPAPTAACRGPRPPGPPAQGHPAAAGADDRGAATIEAAIALCTLAVFLAVAVGAIAAAAGVVRCVDAARELARLAARGEPERGRSVAGQLAPAGARLILRTEGDIVIAEVAAEPLGPLPVRIGGRAVAALEPGALAP